MVTIGVLALQEHDTDPPLDVRGGLGVPDDLAGLDERGT